MITDEQIEIFCKDCEYNTVTGKLCALRKTPCSECEMRTPPNICGESECICIALLETSVLGDECLFKFKKVGDEK